MQIRDGRSEDIDTIERDYWKHIEKLNVTPGKKTVLAKEFSQDYGVDELRALVGKWERGPRIESLFNRVSRRTEIYVLLTDMRPCLNAADVAQCRERSRSPAEMRVVGVCPDKAGPLPLLPQVNCGFPQRKKIARGKRERSRKRRKQAKDVHDSSSIGQKRMRRSVPNTEIDQEALARMFRQKRRKLLSLKSRSKMVKVDKGKEREDRAQQKVKEKEREAQRKELKKKQREEKREEQMQTEIERKERNKREGNRREET